MMDWVWPAALVALVAAAIWLYTRARRDGRTSERLADAEAEADYRVAMGKAAAAASDRKSLPERLRKKGL